jgi:hypothetical protein
LTSQVKYLGLQLYVLVDQLLLLCHHALILKVIALLL